MRLTDEIIKKKIEAGETVALRAGHTIIRLDEKIYHEIVDYKMEEYFWDWELM